MIVDVVLQTRSVEHQLCRVEKGSFQLLAVHDCFVAFSVGHAWIVGCLDAQVALGVLESRIGHIETGVDDTDNDTIALIGLWQLDASACMHLVSMGSLTAVVELQHGFHGFLNELYILQCCHVLQLPGCSGYHQHTSDSRLHLGSSGLYLLASLAGIRFGVKAYDEEDWLLGHLSSSAPGCLNLLRSKGMHHRCQLTI